MHRQDIKLLHLSMMYMYNTHSLLFEKEYDLYKTTSVYLKI